MRSNAIESSSGTIRVLVKMNVLKVKRLLECALLPKASYEGDVGLDLLAAENTVVQPGAVKLIRTGAVIELPPHTEGQIRPRSGLALTHHVTVLNAPSTIDQGYRGEVSVLLINHGRERFEVHVGMRIAQLVVAPIVEVSVEEVGQIDTTQRGINGFGSSGN